jgi:hypothetical protein
MGLRMMLALAFLMAITSGCCLGPRTVNVLSTHSQITTHEIRDEDSARRIVETHIKANRIDISRLEFCFAKEVDTTGKPVAASISDFGPKVWVVRYAPKRRSDEEGWTAGGGVLFWIDAQTGKVVVGQDE